MIKIISRCPACDSDLKISALKCPNCNLELRNDFTLSKFDLLNENQYEFLISFLKNRGNMGAVQDELGMSYPTAKKKLDDLLMALDLAENTQNKEEEFIDMTNLTYTKDSIKASDIIKQKLIENGGRVVVYTARNLPCKIEACSDGISFSSDKLPIKPPYQYAVFDIIVDLLTSQGGRATKGNGRNYKLGEPNCDETTIVGTIGYNYFGKRNGESTVDPVFVFAAVLEWADIAHNERGELVLTNSYKLKLRQNGMM